MDAARTARIIATNARGIGTARAIGLWNIFTWHAWNMHLWLKLKWLNGRRIDLTIEMPSDDLTALLASPDESEVVEWLESLRTVSELRRETPPPVGGRTGSGAPTTLSATTIAAYVARLFTRTSGTHTRNGM